MRLALALACCCALPAAAAPHGRVVAVEHAGPAELPSRGPSDAPVTIELFFTPGPRSRVPAYRALEALQATHPARIRLVYRILAGNGSAQLPYATLEAFTEGKFFAWMEALDATRDALTTPQLLELARGVGLDAGRMLQVISDPPADYREALAANERRRRQRLGGRAGLPAALFDGKAPRNPLTSLSESDLTDEYAQALDAAREMIDRGAPRGALADARAGDDRSLDIAVQAGAIDEELDDLPPSPPLAKPPLSLAGLPSYGPPDAAVAIVVACSPTTANCRAPLVAARDVQDIYPRRVRVVWAPFFDVTRDDAADLSLLADAALCAEQVGTTGGDDLAAASPGWRWVAQMRELAQLRQRRVDPDRLIDALADKLGVERRALSTCRAHVAGTSLAWIEAAHRSGVRASPSTIVGGRIYPPITDPQTLQQLVEAELSPPECDHCVHLGEYAPAWGQHM
jgi:hypothetical protein